MVLSFFLLSPPPLSLLIYSVFFVSRFLPLCVSVLLDSFYFRPSSI